MSRLLGKVPLKLTLIIPFAIQIIVAVGITGWLSYQNGQKTIEALATEVLVQAKYRAKERLDRFLLQPQTIVRENAYAFQTGKISLDRQDELQAFFRAQLQRNQPSPRSVFVGDATGRFLSVELSRFGKRFLEAD
jgi:hypothetical protein